MEKLRKFYIDGEWVTPVSQKTMPVLNPASETEIGYIILAENEDVDIAVSAAFSAFEGFKACSSRIL